jgi:hypothetical protein
MQSGTRFVNLQPARGINADGTLIFTGAISGPGITTANDTAAWLADANGMHVVARESDLAPMSDGARFGDIFTYDAALNDANQFVFRANVTGPGVTPSNSEAIFASDGSSMRKVARSGDPAPVAGATFGGAMSRSVINAQGQVAFFSQLGDGGTTDNAIWSEGLGGLHLVARQSAQAPGLPDGQGFGYLLGGSSQHVINAAGQVAFAAGDSGQGYLTGIWAEDRAGVLHLIAHTNQTIEVAPGDFQTIHELIFTGDSGSQDGRPRSFNDRGQIVFSARLSGGYGVFLSNEVAIPEPSSLFAMTIATVIVFIQYGRRMHAQIGKCTTTTNPTNKA